jgi:hypothetical protein
VPNCLAAWRRGTSRSGRQYSGMRQYSGSTAAVQVWMLVGASASLQYQSPRYALCDWCHICPAGSVTPGGGGSPHQPGFSDPACDGFTNITTLSGSCQSISLVVMA